MIRNKNLVPHILGFMMLGMVAAVAAPGAKAEILCDSARQNLRQSPVLCDSVQLSFRQSKIVVDSTYMGNAKALGHAREMLRQYQRPDSRFEFKGMKVVGAASPEGSVRFNQWLSHKRAERIFDLVGEEINPNDSLLAFSFLGRDWRGLREMVLADSQVPYREEVIELLDEIIADSTPIETAGHNHLARLKQLRGGEPYRYMYRRLFPTLRESRLVIMYGRKPLPMVAIASPGIVENIQITDMEILLVESPAQPRKPFYMGLKTNMLFDLLAVPNIGADIYLGRNFSAVGNWMYGWWDVDRTHHYWRIYGGDLGLRWWFGSKAHQKPLTGHHVGIYGGVVTYDFELGGTGYMGGLPGRPLWDRCNWYCGVEYGFSMPVAKRLNIDFTIGVGALVGKYIVYDPEDGYYVWKETHKRQWFGPTKAEISLVWLIGRGNVNKKGVARYE